MEEVNAFLEANVKGKQIDDVGQELDLGPKERAMDLCYEAQQQRSRVPA